jgi:hypothetical protein
MMRLRDKQWKCRWRPERLEPRPRRKAGNGGYAFLILMMMVTILLISLTAALPSIYTEGQREKEEELIFRGKEYARAILFFHNKFGRYPSSVKELVKKTNGIRFLRHEYRDPMTLKGDWRFIHANGAGMVIDSKTMTLPTGTNNKNGPNQPGQQNPNVLQPGVPNIGGLNRSGQQNSETAQTSEQTQPSPDTDSQTAEAKKGDSSSSSGLLHGAFIVGVASTSKKQSIRLFNNESEYDKWEFLAVGQGVGNLVAPGGPTGGQNQPNAPQGTGGGAGTRPTTGPRTAPPPSPGPI